MNNPLAKDFTFSSLLHFAFPTFVMMLFMGLYTIVDTIFVSQFVNTFALSALNIVCPVINIIVGIGTMIATGGSAIIARQMGAGKMTEAHQNFTIIFVLTILLGLIITLVGLFFIENIIWGLGASPLLFPYCKDYLLIIFIFTPASLLQVLFQSLIVTAGKPKYGFFLSISAGMINIILDYVFIVVFDMGIMGAALGTGFGYMVPAVFGIFFFTNHKGTLSLTTPSFKPMVFIECCTNGSSEMVSQVATAITTFFFNQAMMTLLGESGVAAMTIMIYTQFLFTTLYIGFSMGVAPIISFQYGAQNYKSLKKIYKICLTFIGISSLCIFLASLFSRSQLIQLFTSSDTYVYQIAYSGFTIFLFHFLFIGMNIFTSATFTALSNGKVSAFISFLRTFGFIMIGLLFLPTYFGVTAVWLTVPIAECLTSLISLLLIFIYRKQYHYL